MAILLKISDYLVMRVSRSGSGHQYIPYPCPRSGGSRGAAHHQMDPGGIRGNSGGLRGKRGKELPP